MYSEMYHFTSLALKRFIDFERPTFSYDFCKILHNE